MGDQSVAVFGDTLASHLIAVSQDPAELTEGWWAVVQTFEGDFFGFRFSDVSQQGDEFLESHDGNFVITQKSWSSSINESDYQVGVETIRNHIANGWVYQTNFCRVLTAALETPFDCIGMLKRIQRDNPAPYAGALFVPRSESGLGSDIRIASASPELFLSQDGDRIQSSPIKGTAEHEHLMLEKDSAENVMIVDLIRNDLSHVCRPGSVQVPDLLRVERHPGLTHLVSDVTGTLNDGVSWSQILDAMMPPGSVSGAPKSSSLKVISELESVKREIYCGMFGWIDLDNRKAQLSVGIRTFWQDLNGSNVVKFGTGAGITYGSDPQGEWKETELKAAHLLKVAADTNH